MVPREFNPGLLKRESREEDEHTFQIRLSMYKVFHLPHLTVLRILKLQGTKPFWWADCLCHGVTLNKSVSRLRVSTGKPDLSK